MLCCYVSAVVATAVSAYIPLFLASFEMPCLMSSMTPSVCVYYMLNSLPAADIVSEIACDVQMGRR